MKVWVRVTQEYDNTDVEEVYSDHTKAQRVVDMLGGYLQERELDALDPDAWPPGKSPWRIAISCGVVTAESADNVPDGVWTQYPSGNWSSTFWATSIAEARRIGREKLAEIKRGEGGAH